MKFRVAMILILCLVFSACAQPEKSLKEQDDEYWKAMNEFTDEFHPSFDEIAPLVTKVFKENTGKEALGIPAEKLRKQLITLTKKVKSIKPVPGQERQHENIIEGLGYLTAFAEDCVRIAEGEDLIGEAAGNFTKGYINSLEGNIKVIESHRPSAK